jgi:hypothetical protein
MVGLLPYVEQDSLSKRVHLDEAWDASANREAAATLLRFGCCPTSDFPPGGNPALTSYVGIAGVGADAAALPRNDPRCGFFGYDRHIKLADIKDGLSNTLLVTETSAENGPWAAGGPSTVRGVDPGQQPYIAEQGPFGAPHRPRNEWHFARIEPLANAALADGSVRPLSGSISPQVFEALATIAGGEQVDPTDW